jgi:hypothetical protein
MAIFSLCVFTPASFCAYQSWGPNFPFVWGQSLGPILMTSF